MAEKISVSKAKEILRSRFSAFDKHNRRYHLNAAADDTTRFELLEFGPCGECQNIEIYKIRANGKNAVDLHCDKDLDPIYLQQIHDITAPFPQGMFECEEFDPK